MINQEYPRYLQRITDNGLGSKNNVVTVKNTDFEVFQALDMDSEHSSSANQGKIKLFERISGASMYFQNSGLNYNEHIRNL